MTKKTVISGKNFFEKCCAFVFDKIVVFNKAD